MPSENESLLCDKNVLTKTHSTKEAPYALETH